jgi:hypothetical protein
MKLKPISANMTELALTDGTLVLFSYETPVASWKDGLFSITDKKWSKTTTRHINKWLGALCPILQPQDYFDNLVKGI